MTDTPVARTSTTNDTSPLGKLRALRAAIDREGCPDWNEVLRHGLAWVSSGVAASRRQALTCGDVRALLTEFEAMLTLCKQMKQWLEPELEKEPDRTYFWKLVEVIRKAEGAAAIEARHE
jgi:hypothetical protein